MQTDVLIIGGGPAGLAAAIAARLKGLRVVVVDSRRPPIDKACGEGLLPEAVAALQSLGIEFNSTNAVPFTGIQFSDESSSAEARFPGGTAIGIRRTALHKLLLDRATQAGVSFLWGARVSSIDFGEVCVNGERIRCRWLVGADGQQSSVRRFAKLEPRRCRFRFGFRRHYAIAPWSDLAEVRWAGHCQTVVTPTGTGEVCVALFSSDPHVRMDRDLAKFPDLAGRLRGVQPASSQAGSVTSLARARAVTRNNIALIGDASCTVDGIAGKGLSLAFRQSLALADALASGDLSLYEAAHRRISRPAMHQTRLLLLMDESAAIRRKALRLFETHPAVFAKMISIHAGDSGTNSLDAVGILHLGWRVLWA